MKIFKAELKSGQYFCIKHVSIYTSNGFIGVITSDGTYYFNKDNIAWYLETEKMDDTTGEDIIKEFKDIKYGTNRNKP